MPQCSRCHAELPATSRFCLNCGAAVEFSSETEVGPAAGATPRGRPASEGPAAPPPVRLSRSSSVPEEGRFPPGTVLAQRYRITEKVGQGGMGEVYKATDLLLGQTVALKFLPASLVNNEAMLDRFRNEVRLARQVSHPNVCRVFDLGEAEGHLFLTMEYIDGENLASLLRRIGHLPAMKALEVARRLCAGLAAAHEKGVLHRDLKPANIMLDARGQVLITDFGLAAAEDAVKPGDVRTGTPAYMAPEQLAGREVTARSDIYALGLVLYEMFTGSQPFEAKSWPELIAKQQGGAPPMKGVDPAIERTVARCLEADPRRRPATALALAAALPGGDPLAAALAAGETPSPEMVAAAGEHEGMQPKLALACFALLVVTTLLAAWLASQSSVISAVPSRTTPEAMAEKARDMLARLGYADQAEFEAWDYAYDAAALDRIPSDRAAARRAIAAARPPVVYFWYRGSPSHLSPWLAVDFVPGVLQTDPPLNRPGMTRLRLDPQGRLCFLQAVPEGRVRKPPDRDFEWQQLFEAAGLQMPRFGVCDPLWMPEGAFEAYRAWQENEGTDPLRVEAAVWGGRPVFFRIGRAADDRPAAAARRQELQDKFLFMFASLLVTATLLLAWRSVRLGRADRRSAVRLALAVAGVIMLEGFLCVRHRVGWLDVNHLLGTTGFAAWIGGLGAAGYLALEPFVRRRWPQGLITWTRLLNGEHRDPLVGRHVLIGLLVGVALYVFGILAELVYAPEVGGARWAARSLAYSSPGRIAGLILGAAIPPVALTTLYVLLLLVALALLRNRWAASGLLGFLFAMPVALASPRPLLTLCLTGPAMACGLLLTLRWGLLFAVASTYAVVLAQNVPLTLDTSAWYFPASAATMAVIVGLGFWALRTALAGQPLWKEE